MALEHTTPLRHPRLTGLAVAAAVSVPAALAFGRVFRGPAATWKLVAAVAAAAAVAAVFERRSVWLAATAAAALLVVAAGVLVYPETTLWGLPTEETLSALGGALGEVGTQARLNVAPTPPLAPLVLAATVAVWTATFSAHALSARAGSPLLACLPPAALLAFSDAVLEAEPRAGYGLLFLAGALAVLFVDGLRRVERWGRVWPFPGRRRLSLTTTRGARRVAGAVAACALLFPWLLPGYGSPPLYDVGSSQDEGGPVGLDPLVSIKAQLERREPVELFRVKVHHPAYWRLTALDVFDGQEWTASDPEAARGLVITSAQVINAAVPLAEPFEQDVTISRDIRFRWIPVAYPARLITFPGAYRYTPELQAAVAVDGLHEGDRYTALSSSQVPTPAELRRVEFELRPGVDGTVPPDVRMPRGLSPQITRIAQEWTAAAQTDFDRIMAIQDRLRGPDFEYSLDVASRSDGDALVRFLTVDRRGFCQQFATAMAALLRSLGYPARVAIGFTQGSPDADTGEWVVTTDNAHSWVEVRFPDYGWLAFEPTPSRLNPLAQTYLAPRAPSCIEDPEACADSGQGVEALEPPDKIKGLPRQIRKNPSLIRTRGGGAASIPGPPAAEARRGLPLDVLLLAAGAIVVAFLVVVPPAKALRRRLRLARARGPRDRVIAVYRVFCDRAADLGRARGAGETPSEYVARLALESGDADGSLGKLGAATIRAAFGPGELSESEVRPAASAGVASIKALRRGTPVARRAAGAYRLSGGADLIGRSRPSAPSARAEAA